MSTTASTATPDRILEVATGFMAAKQLFAASRIGLFRALAEGPRDAAGLAEATGAPQRQVRILADSMSAQGLLTRRAGRYTLTEDAAAYLAGEASELDLAPFLGFLNEISYRQWLGYDHTVDTDQAGTLDLDEAGWGGFMAGVMTYNRLHAQQLARVFDFSPYHDALDLGGLSPAFAIEAMEANPQLHTRFVYAPGFDDSVRQALEGAGLADRAVVEAGDTATVQPGGDHDLVLVGHVIHRFDENQNREIFRHARDAAAGSGTLIVLDFFLDEDDTQRALDAAHAGEYYNIDGTVVYPETTVRSWLQDAGWRHERTVGLPGSPRILIATAV